MVRFCCRRSRQQDKQSPNNKVFRPIFSLPDPYQYCLSPKARKRFRVLIQYLLLAFVLLIVILWIGMEVQEYHVKNSPDTLGFYTLPEVCGITIAPENRTDANLTTTDPMMIQTFATQEDAETSPETFVAHCGDCGQCSNPQDVRIYDETKNSLFGSTVQCAKKALLWGRKTAGTCMQETVGFTPGCNDCWLENIMCDVRECVFICLWHGLFHQVEDGSESQELNRCTQCDEQRCGPEFIRCAGANRRRSGIVSDIERDQQAEVCQAVQPNWWLNESVQTVWKQQQAFDNNDNNNVSPPANEPQGR